MPFDPAPTVAARAKRVLRFRLKDKHAKWLSELAREVNFVWNYCNELSYRVWERERRFLSGFDLQGYLNGASKEGLRIGSAVFQQVAEELAARRKQHKKVRLAWRKSRGARRSLGWIPFKARTLTYRSGQVWFSRRPLSLWDSYGLPQYAEHLRAGCFAEDARGRWYLNVVVEVEVAEQPKAAAEDIVAGRAQDIGIDLGLKELACLSDGSKIERTKFFGEIEEKLAVAQRANKKGRVRALHAQAAHKRKDFLHKESTRLVRRNDAIYVGNVNAAAMAKTKRGKSSLDAGWSMFRTLLRYKCDDAGVRFVEVDERYTTRTCSDCGLVGGPKGIAGLGIRGWTCVGCGATHDRDTNAAKNILARGRARLAEGILRL